MRKQFCDAMIERSSGCDRLVFLTGDLGFMALEPLRAAIGKRFVNAGVAEQNMMSVAAAMSREGMECWAYSIGAFCYARPFEQIRNDIAMHGLPVKLVGNGGGYGYGVMGPTHHAIEDYGVLLSLPGMGVCVPAFDEDISAAVSLVGESSVPMYLRLGRGEAPANWAPPAFAPWRQLTRGEGPPVLVVGPLAGAYINAFAVLPESRRPNLWAVGVLPAQAAPPPENVLLQMAETDTLVIAEEHVAHGGFGSSFLLWLAERGLCPRRFRHLRAKSHHYGRYGSQDWLRRQSGLDVESMLSTIGVG